MRSEKRNSMLILPSCPASCRRTWISSSRWSAATSSRRTVLARRTTSGMSSLTSSRWISCSSAPSAAARAASSVVSSAESLSRRTCAHDSFDCFANVATHVEAERGGHGRLAPLVARHALDEGVEAKALEGGGGEKPGVASGHMWRNGPSREGATRRLAIVAARLEQLVKRVC
eukprot:scaffold35662_cov66-Phaeocystis_antarctica.AAC.3